MEVAAAQRGDENVATPHEMVLLFDAIYKGKVLNTDLTTELTKQLSTLKPSYIPRELPDGVQVANKPGELEGVRTDSGIVFSANRPFALSVMTAYARDERAAERAITRCSGSVPLLRNARQDFRVWQDPAGAMTRTSELWSDGMGE